MKSYFLVFILILASALHCVAQGTVKGFVMDAEGPMPGVNVAVKGTANGTITDPDGIFYLHYNNPNDVLQFSFIGYKTEVRTVAEILDADTVVMKMDDVEIEVCYFVDYRVERAMQKTAIPTRSIGVGDIKRADATNVEDLLQQELPGVEFTYAKSQQVNMNFSGFAGQSVLFLVDGERLAGENVDNVDFSRIDMSNVKRVDIIKGAASAVYGSSANGGVINIITNDPDRPLSVDVNQRFGAHGESRSGIKVAVSNKKIDNTFTFGRTSINHFDLKNGDEPEALVFSEFFASKTFNYKDVLNFRPSPSDKITARAGYFMRENVRTQGAPERYYDFSGGIRYHHSFGELDAPTQLDLSYSFDEYDKSDYQELTRLNIRDYSNVQNSLKALLKNKHVFRDGTIGVITVGADFMHDYLLNYYFSDKYHEQNTGALFAQYNIISGNWDFVGAVRGDYFGDGDICRASPKFSVSYSPENRPIVRLSYGKGFRAPTLKERYTDFDIQGMWVLRGNRGLKAEDSHNFSLSADYSRWKYNFNVLVYYNSVSNRIATCNPRYDADGTRYIQYINLDGLRVFGGEVSANYVWSCGIRAKASYVYTHESKETASMSQYTPPREHSFNTSVSWEKRVNQSYKMDLMLSGRFLSSVWNEEYVDMLDESKGTRRNLCPAYTIWKLSSVHSLGKYLTVSLAVDNIFNYKPEYYYSNAPITTGANLMVGVGCKW